MVKINLFQHAEEAETLTQGAVLFREGEAGDVMFAIVEGEVDLSHRGVVIETVGPGDILGEMALVDSTARSATATARTQAKVVPVDREQFGFLVHEHPTFALNVMTVMAERLRRANDARE
jgi:CRP/FNR family transcriptional regulator, cyclic AMP receptor protein